MIDIAARCAAHRRILARNTRPHHHVAVVRPDEVHDGSDDLFVWPPSAPELALAVEWLDTGMPAVRDELYVVAQSEDRAAAICEKATIDRRAIAADAVLARAFGGPPADRWIS